MQTILLARGLFKTEKNLGLQNPDKFLIQNQIRPEQAVILLIIKVFLI